MSAVALGFVPGIVTGLLSEGLTRYTDTRNNLLIDDYMLTVLWNFPNYKYTKGWEYLRNRSPEVRHQKKLNDQEIGVIKKNCNNDIETNNKHLCLSLSILTVGTIALSILFRPATLTRGSYPYYAYIALSVTSSLVGAMIPIGVRELRRPTE